MNDKAYLRELAKKYADIASMPFNKEIITRMQRTNDLTSGLRPTVLLDEIPWHEMNINGELDLICSTEEARHMERFFKQMLYRFKYIKADTVFYNFFPIMKSYSSTGIGLEVEEDVVKTDSSNNIVSHSYHDKLETYEALEQIKEPVLTAYKDKDELNVSMAEDVLGDILPTKLMGYQIYYAPWDQIPRLRGVEPILMDMYDRPEFLHDIIKKYTSNQESVLRQMEELDLLENELTTLHCTPAHSNDLPKLDADGKVRLKNVWFRAMAQMFNTISPDAHEEFEMQYMRPLMAKCGLVYYGCCEPLHDRIEMLKTVPNMRKIGVSPWADLEMSAEKMGGGYVYARKPNPANVALNTDEAVIEKEIRETVEICLKYGCPYEFVIKDISTVSYKPQNLITWTNTVNKVLDSYY